jgi:hypothetical protein
MSSGTMMTAAAAAAALSSSLGLGVPGAPLPSASSIEEVLRANYNDSSNFGKKHLTIEQKQYIIEAHERNESTRAIAMQMGVGKSSVAAVIQRWKLEKRLDRQPGQGRKRKTSDKDEKYFVSKVRSDPSITVKKLLQDNACPMLSETTLRCRLREARQHVKDGVPLPSGKNSTRDSGDLAAAALAPELIPESISPTGTLIVAAVPEEYGANSLGGAPFEPGSSSSAAPSHAPKKRKIVAISKAVMI